IDPNTSFAERFNCRDVVADEEDRAAFPRHVAHLAEAFALKFRVADGEHFIHDQNVGLEMCGDGEGEAHEHAAAVSLYGRVKESLDTRERHNLVKTLCYVAAAHPENASVEIDILATRQFAVKASADFE